MAGAAAKILSNALFGSRGRREETEQSDVDVGVLFQHAAGGSRCRPEVALPLPAW